MFNKFLICWSELRHSRKFSAKQAESAIINAGLSICVRVVCECVCAFWCVWFMRLAGSLPLRALHFFIRLPKQRHRRVYFLEQFTPPPPPSRQNPSHFGGGSSQVFFFSCFCYTALLLPLALSLSLLRFFLTACLDWAFAVWLLVFGFVSFDDFWIVSNSSQWRLPLPLPFGLPACSFCFRT